MMKKMEEVLAETYTNFRLPRSNELPDMGLYLEQTSKYVNTTLSPLGFPQVTGSMIRNYVKMGLINNPVKKCYYADHIQHIIAVTILKSVMSMDHINMMFTRQTDVYTNDVAYDYMCSAMENIMSYRFGLTDTVEDIGFSQSDEKTILDSALVAVSHIIYMNACFEWLNNTSEDDNLKEQ